MSRPDASHLDAFALAAQAADDVVFGTVREMHDAIAGRVHGGPARWGGTVPALTWWLHSTIASGVFASVSSGLRLSSVGLRLASRHGARGGDLESSGYGRFLSGAVNGRIGDQLREDDDPVFFKMSVRVRGREVPCDPESLSGFSPEAGARVVVFVHGLCETEDVWWRSEVPVRDEDGEERPRTSYGDRLAHATSWTSVYLRVNTGLPVAENGVALAALLDRLVHSWPVAVSRLALVGHSMGGLVVRAAGAVSTDRDESWTDVVTDVVCLGTPHHGAPLERVVERGVRLLGGGFRCPPPSTESWSSAPSASSTCATGSPRTCRTSLGLGTGWWEPPCPAAPTAPGRSRWVTSWCPSTRRWGVTATAPRCLPEPRRCTSRATTSTCSTTGLSTPRCSSGSATATTHPRVRRPPPALGECLCPPGGECCCPPGA